MAISTTGINIREFQPAEQEYETLVGISNAVFPEYEISATEWRYFDDNFDRTKYAFKRYVAEEPETGKLVAWNNLLADGSPNGATLHQGMKVRRGTKYVITKWFREYAAA